MGNRLSPPYTRVFKGRGELIDHIFASHRLVNPRNKPVARTVAATDGLPSVTEDPEERGAALWLGCAGWMALGYGGLCLMLFMAQRSFIDFPRPAADPTGRLELLVQGKRVLVAHRPHSGPQAMIYFGGNAEDVSLTRAELAALLPDTALYLPAPLPRLRRQRGQTQRSGPARRRPGPVCPWDRAPQRGERGGKEPGHGTGGAPRRHPAGVRGW
jgi:hypothetical protein